MARRSTPGSDADMEQVPKGRLNLSPQVSFLVFKTVLFLMSASCAERVLTTVILIRSAGRDGLLNEVEHLLDGYRGPKLFLRPA